MKAVTGVATPLQGFVTDTIANLLTMQTALSTMKSGLQDVLDSLAKSLSL